MMDDKLKKYPKTDLFEVIDTIGVPHPYCITPKHLTGQSMYLGKEEIRDAEKYHDAKCDICRKLYKKGKQERILTIDEHEIALLVKIKDKSYSTPGDVPGLREYLRSIKELTESDKFVGYALTH